MCETKKRKTKQEKYLEETNTSFKRISALFVLNKVLAYYYFISCVLNFRFRGDEIIIGCSQNTSVKCRKVP